MDSLIAALLECFQDDSWPVRDGEGYSGGRGGWTGGREGGREGDRL